MRTGIKHLLGLSATLLLLLTVIAWVDSYSTQRTALNVSGVKSWIVLSRNGWAHFDFAESPARPPQGWHMATAPADHHFVSYVEHYDPNMFVIGLRPAVQLEMSDGTSLWTFGVGVRYGFIAFVGAICLCLYLHFLFRRRRTSREPTSEGADI